MTFKSKGEAPIMTLKARVMSKLRGIKLNEVAAQGQKQSNGLIEEAGKTTSELVRTLLSTVEEAIEAIIRNQYIFIKSLSFIQTAMIQMKLDSSANKSTILDLCFK